MQVRQLEARLEATLREAQHLKDQISAIQLLDQVQIQRQAAKIEAPEEEPAQVLEERNSFDSKEESKEEFSISMDCDEFDGAIRAPRMPEES